MTIYFSDNTNLKLPYLILIIPGLITAAYYAQSFFRGGYELELGIVCFLMTVSGVIWTLIALGNSGEGRARLIACFTVLTGLSPISAQLASDTTLALSTFLYDGAIAKRLKAQSPHALQTVLQERPYQSVLYTVPASESLIYDGSDALRKDPDGMIMDFVPYHRRYKAHSILRLRGHYYRVIKDSFQTVRPENLEIRR